MTSSPAWVPDWTAVEPTDVTLLVGWETSSKTVQVRRLPISVAVAADLEIPVRATTALLAQSDVVPYTAELELDDLQLAVVPRDQLEPESTLLQGLELNPPAEAEAADLDRPLLFYAVAVTTPRRLVFLRRMNPRSHLGQQKRFFTTFGDELEVVQDPILAFDTDGFDLVLVDGEGVVASRLTAFERLFRDSPELLRRMPQKVADLHAVLPMSQSARAVLEERATNNSRIRVRLLSAIGRGHLPTVPLQALRDSMARHGLDVDRHLVDGELTFDASDALTVMQVLNEDLAFGDLTDTEFVINKKSPR